MLEGFLTVLLGEDVKIIELLESESNQQTIDDKFNRVNIKARNSKDEIIIVEIQNTRELYYLERILYGVAKVIMEHISLGERCLLVISFQRAGHIDTAYSMYRSNMQAIYSLYIGCYTSLGDLLCIHS